ncbi:MAG: hypothetical protein QOJ79_2230 [Actinomycetota bacterium]|nr:hypothetical protein [Actinomycetota bacterium]
MSRRTPDALFGTRMSTHRITRSAAAVAVGVAVIAAATAAPSAADADPRVVQVSGVNPQPECSVGAGQDPAFPATRDWDQEPSLAVSPRNPSHLQAAWMQGYSDGITAARSEDGGRSWTVSAVPILDCTKTHSTIDPWLAIGPNTTSEGETTYLSVVTTTAASGTTATVGAIPDTDLVVLRSYDGGTTWSSTPRKLDHAGDVEAIDGSLVVTDPVRPGRAWARWSKVNLLTLATDEFVATTADGFEHWSTALLPASPVGTVALGTQLAVGPDGCVAAVSAVIPQTQFNKMTMQRPSVTGPTDLYVTTSTNGTDWTPQRKVANADSARFANISLAADGSGRVKVAWTRLSGPGVQPMLMSSTDTGRTWTTPAPAGPPVLSAPFLANSDILAAPTVVLPVGDGPTVALYDHRNDDATSHSTGEPPHVTDIWLRKQINGVWTEQHVLGPFDGTTGPAGNGSVCESDCVAAASILGDYWGGVALPHGQVGVTVVTTNPTPDSPHNTDVFFARSIRARG